jgi:hypothetical protein
MRRPVTSWLWKVSSIWRSTDAGMEDAYIHKWFQNARKIVAGRVPGKFYITLPIKLPRGADAGRFAEALVDTILMNQTAIARDEEQAGELASHGARDPTSGTISPPRTR